MDDVWCITSKNSRQLTYSLVLLQFCLTILLPGVLVTSSADKWPADRTEKLQLAQKTITALESAVNHLFVVGDGVNFDAVFGLRLVEDQLRAFRFHVVDPYLSREKNGDLTSLIESINGVHDKVRDYRLKLTKVVEINQPEYYKHLSFIITDGNWELWYPQRDVDRSFMPTYGFEKTVDEVLKGHDSDTCMMEAYQKQCQFSKMCWARMEESLMNGYSLTHQILFIIVSIVFGCKKEMEMSALKWTNMSADEILSREFAAVLHEAELIAAAGYPLYQRDLFLEQAAFAGILGYRDFFRQDWLKEIFSWQDETGCYSLDYNATVKEFRRDFPNRTTPFIYLRAVIPSFVKSGVKTRRGELHDTNQHHRLKRTEVILSDGCWAHMTAVGMNALGQYVRFLLESLMDN